jgi:hypothetical protein
MVQEGHGNLLQADAEALVNTVNTVGYMGKGIALQFKQAFPENFRALAIPLDFAERAVGCALLRSCFMKQPMVFKQLHASIAAVQSAR